jgi:beta-glucosidase
MTSNLVRRKGGFVQSKSPETSGFPSDFTWGVMLAAFCWEGAAFEDDKGASDWDMFASKPGVIAHGDRLDVACDGYHRYEEDVALMKQFGVQAHDLTIAWSRVLPDGVGSPNEKGLDFYDRFIDALLDAGVEPWVTLYHHALPLALYRRGGWLNRDVVEWFPDFATLMVERLSDRVSHWLTFELPEEVINLGYELGIEAPGNTVALPEVLQGAHNVLLSHGKAMQAIRASARQPVKAGVSTGSTVWMPASDSDADIEAAQKAMFSVPGKSTDNNVWWMDPILLGRYPEDGLELFGADAPTVQAGDMETIAQPLDFLGTGIYSGARVVASANGGYEKIPHPPGMPRSSLGWSITPEALYWGPRLLHERYGKPIVITENGMAGHDWVSLDGAVHDPLRIDSTRRYLLELERAIAGGVSVDAYFHWTWIDNFECGEGFAARYGMIHCDFETLKRTPKDSAYWYRDVVQSNGVSLHEDPAPVSA